MHTFIEELPLIEQPNASTFGCNTSAAESEPAREAPLADAACECACVEHGCTCGCEG